MTDTPVKKDILRSIRAGLRKLAHIILIPFVSFFGWLSAILAKV